MFDDDDDDFSGDRGTLTCRDVVGEGRFSMNFELCDDDSSRESTPRKEGKRKAPLAWFSSLATHRSFGGGSTSRGRPPPPPRSGPQLPEAKSLPPPASNLPTGQPLPPPARASTSREAVGDDEELSSAPTAAAPAGKLQLSALLKSVGNSSSATTRAPTASLSERARGHGGPPAKLAGRPAAPAGRLQLGALPTFRSGGGGGGGAATRRGGDLSQRLGHRSGIGGLTARLRLPLFSTAHSRALRAARELEHEREEINSLIKRAGSEGVPLTLRDRRKSIEEQVGPLRKKVQVPTEEELEMRAEAEGELERINRLISLRSTERSRLAGFANVNRQSLSLPSSAEKLGAWEEFTAWEEQVVAGRAAEGAMGGVASPDLTGGPTLVTGSDTASESPPSTVRDASSAEETVDGAPSGASLRSLKPAPTPTSRWAHLAEPKGKGKGPPASPGTPQRWQLPASSFAGSPKVDSAPRRRLSAPAQADDVNAPKAEMSKDRPRRMSARLPSQEDEDEADRVSRGLQPAVSPTYRNRGMMQASRRLQLLVSMRNMSPPGKPTREVPLGRWHAPPTVEV